MRQRDKAIINDLNRFRVMSRDDLIDLHFRKLKRPVTACNTVMKRLRRDGHVKAVTNYGQYIYMPYESKIKPDSTKIPHFLRIVGFYRDVRKHERPKIFTVEPKYGAKGTVEPDIFMIWKGSPFFVEIQRTQYTQKVMDAKLDRYEAYYHGEEWKKERWQPKKKAYFPHVWIITDTQYKISKRPYQVMQSATVDELFAAVS